MRETKRALLWGAVVLIVAALLVSPWVLLIYPLQVLRLSRRGSPTWAFLTVLGKILEALGYYWRRLRDGKIRLFEYK